MVFEFVLLASVAATIAPGDAAGPPLAPDDTVELVFVGDILLAANLPPGSPYDAKVFNYPFEFARVAPYFQHADISFCNLESPISGRGRRLDKVYAFNAPPPAALGLAQAGLQVVSLANNHCLDYGEEALSDTLENLSRHGVKYAGLSTDHAPQVPVILERKGVRIAYLAYQAANVLPPQFNGFHTQPAKAEKDVVAGDIERLRGQADIIVVSFHWGQEYTPQHDATQADLGHAAIDAGAQIVAGHHPHVQQEPEWYKGGLIIYSMGNFIFGKYSRPPAQKTRLYRVNVDKNGIRQAEYLPLEIVGGPWRPEPQSETFVPLTPPR